MARAVEVKIVQRGVREVLKSDGVERKLGDQAKKAAASCNEMLDPKLKKRGAEYTASTKVMGFTAGGVVRCGGAYHGLLAAIDNSKNNTLKKGCGV